MIEPVSCEGRQRGQSLLEFALALPFLLLLMLGVFEFGRIVFIYSSANNASREAARYGAATGFVPGGLPHYLACNEIRNVAREKAFLAGLQAADIEIGYDRPDTDNGKMEGFATCDGSLAADDIKVGDRIVVTVTANINPILSILPLPTFSPTFVTARTVLKNIVIGPVECSDGKDNDGDGLIDWKDDGTGDDGCTSPNDTTESLCFSLNVFGKPSGGGSLQVEPAPNCANRYIEDTEITLQANPAEKQAYNGNSYPLYSFINWTGTYVTVDNPFTFYIVSDTELYANFHKLEADLQVSKVADKETVGSEEELTYTVGVYNDGPDTAHGVLITDTLPADSTFGSAVSTNGLGTCTHSGEPTGGTVICEVDELGVLITAEFEIVITTPIVNATDVSIINQVSATPFETDPDLTNNDATVETFVVPRAEIRAIEKLGPEQIDAATQFDYTITVGNDGPSLATGVKITDPLPPDVIFISSADGCSDADINGVIDGIVECDIGTLVSGETATVTFSVTAPAEGTDPDTPLVNEATVSAVEYEQDDTNNTASVVTAVMPVADLSISKAGLAEPTRDQPFDYTITVVNKGPSTATGVTVVDTITAGDAEFNEPLPEGCTFGAGGVTCDLPDLSPDPNASNHSYTFVLSVTPREIDALENTATVTEDISIKDDDTSNNTAKAGSSVGIDSNLEFTKSATNSSAAPGDPISYQITVKNLGLSDARNVHVEDVLHKDLAFVSAGGGNWSCSESGGTVSCDYDNGFGVRTLPAGQSASFTVNVTLSATSTESSIVNTANLSTDIGNPSASATTTVNAADLSLSISAPTDVVVTTKFDYVLTVTNNGPKDATNVTVTDKLPSGITLLSTTGGSCTGTSTVECAIASLLAGQSTTLTLAVRADTSGEKINDASITYADQVDPVSSNNNASHTMQVNPQLQPVALLPEDIVVYVKPTFNL